MYFVAVAEDFLTLVESKCGSDISPCFVLTVLEPDLADDA